MCSNAMMKSNDASLEQMGTFNGVMAYRLIL
jgi:hypothetical protein